MLRTLQKLSEQLQQQAVVIKRTFVERGEADSQAACGQRPRYFSDSAVVLGTGASSDVDVLSDICSSGADWTVKAEHSTGENSSTEAETSEDGFDSPASCWSDEDDDELSWRHVNTMSPCNAMHPDAASFGAIMQPQVLPVPQGIAASQRHLEICVPQPQFIALVPASAVQCSAAAPAVASTGAAVAVQPAAGVIVPPRQQSGEATSATADSPQRASTPRAVDSRTSLMVRNVPNNLSRDQFVAMLDRKGLASLYDFVYLPVDFQTGAGLGYGFINAVDSSAAKRIWEVLDGFTRWAVRSRKKCSVVWNDPHQGLEENVERYRNSPVMHPLVPDSYKPAVFSDGVRVAYPSPTKALKAPRLKKQA